MYGHSMIQGPGYAVNLPPGFQVLMAPIPGNYILLPPGANTGRVEALATIRSVNPFDRNLLLQNLYNLEEPTVATVNLRNLNLVQLLAMAPVRREQMPDRLLHVREFDAVTINNFPVRVMVIVIESAQAWVEVVLMMNLWGWTEFVGPCLSLLAAVQLAGSPATAPPDIRAVIDRSRPDQVEYQLVNADCSVTPLTALPTVVGNVTVYNIDNSIRTGDIHGTGIVLGQHNIATVEQTNVVGVQAPISSTQSAPSHKEQVMTNNPQQGNFNVGNVSGQGIAVGHGASARVTINAAQRDELRKLVEELRAEIQKAAIPDATKNVLLNKAVPEMQKSAEAEDPKSGFERGIERISDQLEGVEGVASKVGGIVGTVTKIAAAAGVAIKGVAPFLAGLL